MDHGTSLMVPCYADINSHVSRRTSADKCSVPLVAEALDSKSLINSLATSHPELELMSYKYTKARPDFEGIHPPLNRSTCLD